MALPATDLFTSATNQALATYSAAWTVTMGAFVVNTDGICYGSVNQTSLARWNADAFAASHYIEAVIGNVSAGSYAGAAVGLQAGAASGYYFIFTTGGSNEFGRVNAGSDAPLDTSVTQVWAAGDVLRIEISYPNGTTTRIVIKRAPAATPTVFTTLLTYNDTSGSRLTGGGAGLAAYGNNAGLAGITAVTMGDLGGGGTTQDLAGGATGQGTAAGSANVTKPLASGAAGQGGAAGTISSGKDLAGGAAGAGTATGNAAVGKPLAGGAAGFGGADGTLLGGATITTRATVNDSNGAWADHNFPLVTALRMSDGVQACIWTNQVASGLGVLTLNHPSLVAGQWYAIARWEDNGSGGWWMGIGEYQAA